MRKKLRPQTANRTYRELRETSESFVDFKREHRVTVKWYCAQKGYGFVRLRGYRRDIFLHAAVARRARVYDLRPGDDLAVKITAHPITNKKVIDSIHDHFKSE